MEVQETRLDGLLLFIPSPHYDERGFFTRTFEATAADEHGLRSGTFTQDSQSRSRRGVVRGLHGRAGIGEAKLVRCARGSVHDVVVDARPTSATFGQHESFRLDDLLFWHLYIPPGMLHGFQVTSDWADVCYRIDRPHDPDEDLAVRYDDPELAINWPEPVTIVSDRDASAGSWSSLRGSLSTPRSPTL